jgi:hypothetical protein
VRPVWSWSPTPQWEYVESKPDLPPWQVECRVCCGLGFEVAVDDHDADDSRHSAPYDLGGAMTVTLPAA